MFPSIKLLSLLAVAFSVTSALPLDTRASGPGITLTNKGSKSQLFSFFENIDNGNGWAVPDYTNAKFPTTLKAGETKFVSLKSGFKGRVQRGNDGKAPATWVEFQLMDGAGKAWGDVSIQPGNDGAATLKSATNNVQTGFTQDLITGAPPGAFAKLADGTPYKKADGTVLRALGGTAGNWIPANTEALEWYKKKITDKLTYFLPPSEGGTSGTVVANSDNAQFIVNFY